MHDSERQKGEKKKEKEKFRNSSRVTCRACPSDLVVESFFFFFSLKNKTKNTWTAFAVDLNAWKFEKNAIH